MIDLPNPSMSNFPTAPRNISKFAILSFGMFRSQTDADDSGEILWGKFPNGQLLSAGKFALFVQQPLFDDLAIHPERDESAEIHIRSRLDSREVPARMSRVRNDPGKFGFCEVSSRFLRPSGYEKNNPAILELLCVREIHFRKLVSLPGRIVVLGIRTVDELAVCHARHNSPFPSTSNREGLGTDSWPIRQTASGQSMTAEL